MGRLLRKLGEQADDFVRFRKNVPSNAPTRSEVAIVVPCYNAELHLDRALHSVFAQTYRDFRVFAVNDCSSDGTLEILRSYQQCSVTSLEARMGPSAARNQGIRASESPFVAFLDADDEWLPRKLEHQLAVMKDDPSLGMICSLCARSTQGDQGIVMFGEPTKPQSGNLFEKLVRRCFVYTPTVIVRRECLEDVGLFNENLRVSEDFNLWLRIAAKWPVALLPEVLAVAHARLGGLSLSTSPEERFSNGVAALEDVRSRCPDLSAAEFRALQITLSERIYCHGAYLLANGAAHRSREKFRAALKLQHTHSRAMVKLGLSFLPPSLSKSLLKFGQTHRSRTQPNARPDLHAAESSRMDAYWRMAEKGMSGVQIFDQRLLDALLATPVSGSMNRALYRILRGIRRLRLLWSDPLVSFSLGAFKLKLPLSHELPFYRRSFPTYAINLGRITRHVSRKYPDLTVIDVGANVGDSVAILRHNGLPPILCVEGEPRFFQLLTENTRHLEDLELEQTFVGANGDQFGSIYSHHGNAEVRLGLAPGTAKLCTLSEVIARHPRFSGAKLLKLDAEGFDCRIIASENELLRRTRPVLFFEYYPTCCELTGQAAFPVFSQLAALGYSNLLIYENQGRYSKALELGQTGALTELHESLVKVSGYFDVVAFHAEDSDIAEELQIAEEAAQSRGARYAGERSGHALAH